ncbi:hypothetical protein EhV18_00181 [Emiliania huxleyi virus 18]|nr:hypothetical protein EhV18_00181 [Emiliania huxleyi virus 18]
MTTQRSIHSVIDIVVTKSMYSTPMEHVSEFVSVYDEQIVRGSTVF